ncbi:MAG: DNA polymerase III subunit delta' [Arcobacteraceae bacterium]|jgi:DNA polymerase-3 subunit delta'|nr:DNA polymerase III subunit delta' [Arcobacteraceae bacterium]
MTFNTSTILIVNDIEESLVKVISTLPKHDVRIIKNEEEGKRDFLILHAKQVVKEAYIASERLKYIILCGETFTVEAQNSLLKILEEPPKNTLFIIITNSKSGILKTIFSRLPHHYLKTKKERMPAPIDLAKMELKDVYNFLKTNQRITKGETKEIIESLLYSANEKRIKLTTKELESFSMAMKLCELNSRPINILTTLLLTLMRKR